MIKSITRFAFAILSILPLVETANAATSAAIVEGVVTRQGKPAKERAISIGSQTVLSDERGYFRIDNVPEGVQTVHIRTGISSSRRQFPDVEVKGPRTVTNYDIASYYAAELRPWDHDWRLHMDWNNNLDNPWALSSLEALRTNTRTVSGWLLKPVYATAAVAEAAWTLPGLAIGLPLYLSPQLFGEEPDVNLLSGSLLLGYLPIEAVAKAVEVPVKTILWPLDRISGAKARRELDATRQRVMGEID